MTFANRIAHFFHTGTHTQLPLPFTEPPTTRLEEQQRMLSHFVRLVLEGFCHGLLVAGPGGLGKTKTILDTLTAAGVHYKLINSHATPLALYGTLYEHRNAVVVLDDAEAIFANPQVLGILRSALWGERVITYQTTQGNGLPSQFTFSGKIIASMNRFPKKNPAFTALESRCDKFTLCVDREAVFEQMRQMATKGFGRLTPEQCGEVVDFIEQNLGSRSLSLRLYELAVRKREYALDNAVSWQEIVAVQLTQLGDEQTLAGEQTARELDETALEEAVARHPDSVRHQEHYWCEVRGKSRASFYRLKKSQSADTGTSESN